MNYRFGPIQPDWHRKARQQLSGISSTAQRACLGNYLADIYQNSIVCGPDCESITHDTWRLKTQCGLIIVVKLLSSSRSLWEWPWEFLKALLGITGRGLEFVAIMTPENAKKAIKGLAFLILGIVVQLVPYVVTVCCDIAKTPALK